MAIEIPTIRGFNSKVFDLAHRQQLTAAGAGAIQTIDRSRPMWVAEYTTPSFFNAEDADNMQSFLDRLEMSKNPFLAYDPRRIMPKAYASLPITARPWTQAGHQESRLVATSFADSTLSLDRLRPGAVISNGDYISVFINPAWYIFRVVTGIIVAGNTATVSVIPRPVITGIPAVNIRYTKAVCAMKLVERADISSSVESGTSFSFSAAQFINRGSAA